MGLDQQAVHVGLFQLEPRPVHLGQVLLQPGHHLRQPIGAPQPQQ
jgi:hypothetical protein